VSYLVKYATRRPTPMRRYGLVRLDEKTPLNKPGFHGDAYVRVFVEDTSGRRYRKSPPAPRLRLRIADCTNVINLEFSVESAPLRENSLFKIDTLLEALGRFRETVAAEAELYAEREVRCGPARAGYRT
jgi:hypothetical protein